MISKKTTTIFLSLKIEYVSPNSADPDEMPHSVAFHLGLHCLQKYLISVTHLQSINCLKIYSSVYYMVPHL